MDIQNVVHDIPIVVIRTKSDIDGFIENGTIPISTKLKENLYTPFTFLLRSLTGYDDLEIEF